MFYERNSNEKKTKETNYVCSWILQFRKVLPNIRLNKLYWKTQVERTKSISFGFCFSHFVIINDISFVQKETKFVYTRNMSNYPKVHKCKLKVKSNSSQETKHKGNTNNQIFWNSWYIDFWYLLSSITFIMLSIEVIPQRVLMAADQTIFKQYQYQLLVLTEYTRYSISVNTTNSRINSKCIAVCYLLMY